MKRIKIILIIITLIPAFSFSQAPSIQWAKVLGGTDDDEASSAIQTRDGGYIVAGLTWSNDGDVSGNHGPTDYWIVKLDTLGDLVWQKCYGGTYSEEARCIIQINDGGYVICGSAASNDGDVGGIHGTNNFADYWVIKIDSVGDLIWHHVYGGSGDEWGVNSIQQTTDGGFIVVGTSPSNDGDVSCLQLQDNYWVVKISSSGNFEWGSCFGGTDYDTPASIKQTIDGGYIISGNTFSTDGDVTNNHGSSDAWIVKIDSLGSLQWQRCYGGSFGDKISSILQLLNGEYIGVGFTSSIDGDVIGNHGGLDFWVIKLDNNGNLLWQQCYGGTGDDIGVDIKPTLDGGYILFGSAYSNDGQVTDNHGSSDYWLVKIDSVGNVEWDKALGGSLDEFGWQMSVTQTRDEGYLVAGFSTSSDGDVGFNNGGINCGWGPGVCPDYWIVKLAPLGNKIHEINHVTGFKTYHSSNSNFLSIEFFSKSNESAQFQLLDITGRIILLEPIKIIDGLNSQQILTNELSSGVYLTRLVTKWEAITRKLIVE